MTTQISTTNEMFHICTVSSRVVPEPYGMPYQQQLASCDHNTQFKKTWGASGGVPTTRRAFYVGSVG